MKVKTFDENKLNKLLKECNPYILLYIKKLKESNARWESLTQKAIKKIRELSRSNNEQKS